MSFGAFSKKAGVPWNGRPAPVQRYRYFPAIVKKGIAFLSGGASYEMGWGGWRRRSNPMGREAKRRALLAMLRDDPRAVPGLKVPADVCEKSAHRRRMNDRLVARLNAEIRRHKAKRRPNSLAW